MFWGDYDQRHTVNLFGQYRRSPRSSLSARFRYGSNFPLVGYYQRCKAPACNGSTSGRPGATFLVSHVRNTERVPAYARLDLRWDRAFVRTKRRFTVYAEATNLLGRANVRQEFHGYWSMPDGTMGYTSPLGSNSPLIPSVGVMIDF